MTSAISAFPERSFRTADCDPICCTNRLIAGLHLLSTGEKARSKFAHCGGGRSLASVLASDWVAPPRETFLNLGRGHYLYGFGQQTVAANDETSKIDQAGDVGWDADRLIEYTPGVEITLV